MTGNDALIWLMRCCAEARLPLPLNVDSSELTKGRLGDLSAVATGMSTTIVNKAAATATTTPTSVGVDRNLRAAGGRSAAIARKAAETARFTSAARCSDTAALNSSGIAATTKY